MKRLRFLTMIAVFTALFASCEEPVEVIYPSTGGGNSGTEVDYTKFKCLKTLAGQSHNVYSVAYSPDGTKFISGSRDKTIKIWDANTGQCLKTLEGHSYGVESVAFSPDGTKIISGSEGGSKIGRRRVGKEC